MSRKYCLGNSFVAVVLASALLLVGAASSQARSRGYSGPKKGKPGVPNKVVSTDCSANTITVKHGDKNTTYTVDKFTVITVNDKTADLTAVKPGMEVTINASGPGGTVATRIDADGAGSAPAEAKPSKKKK